MGEIGTALSWKLVTGDGAPVTGPAQRPRCLVAVKGPCFLRDLWRKQTQPRGMGTHSLHVAGRAVMEGVTLRA